VNSDGFRGGLGRFRHFSRHFLCESISRVINWRAQFALLRGLGTYESAECEVYVSTLYVVGGGSGMKVAVHEE
jgi:hypothetical protein